MGLSARVWPGRSQAPRRSASSGSVEYDAFVSYSHAADGQLAPALQAGLQSLGKPWYRRRVLRVFRDKTSLSASPELWPSIERALATSRYFVLLASPEAAASRWVDQEVSWWLEHRSPATMLIGLTGGDLVWDDARGVFDQARSTALPPAALRWSGQEPLWVDLRWVHETRHVSLRDPRFREVVADLAAPVRALPKDELIGEDIRQHRRTMRLARSAVASLAALALLASSAAVIAVQQRDEARSQARRATSRQLASTALTTQSDQYDLALLLALEANRIQDTPQSRSSLLATMQHNSQLVTFLRGSDAPITSLAWSPDERTVAAGTSSGSIALWDAASFVLRRKVQTGTGAVTAVSFSPDGATVASGSGNGEIGLWDLDTGRLRTKLGGGHLETVRGLAFDRAGALLASGDDGGTVQVWDVAERVAVSSFDTATNVKTVLFGHNGRSVLAGTIDGSVVQHDLRNGRTTAPFGALTPIRTSSLAYDRDADTVAIANFEGDILLWNTATGNTVGKPLASPRNIADSMLFSPDGRTLASGHEGMIVLWDAHTGKRRGQVLDGYPGRTEVMAFSPSGRRLASAAGPSVLLWDTQPRRRLAEPLAAPTMELPYAAQATSVAFAQDGRTLAWIVDPMKRLVIWDAARRQPIGELSLDRLPEGNAVVDLAFSPDGQTIATSSQFVGALGDGQEQEGVALWNLQDRRPRLLPIDQKEPTGVVFTTDGRTLVSFSADGSIYFVDVASGRVQGRWSTGEAGLAAAVSPDGRYLAVEQHDGSVVLWETSTRRRLGTLGGPSAASGGLSMRFSPDGNALAIANPDGVITLWDIPSRRPQKVLSFSQAADIAFGTQTIAAATPNGTIVLWDIESGQQLGVLEDAGSKEVTIAFSPDGRTLASVRPGGSATLWKLDVSSWRREICAIARRDLTQTEWDQHIGTVSERRPSCPQ